MEIIMCARVFVYGKIVSYRILCDDSEDCMSLNTAVIVRLITFHVT